MTSPRISRSENYEIIDPYLGKGSFGVVSKIKMKDTSDIFALKTVKLGDLSTPKEKEELLQESIFEYKLLKKGLPNVVRSFGSNYDQNNEKFMFSMEYYPQNLKQYVTSYLNKTKNSMSFELFLPLFHDILNG